MDDLLWVTFVTWYSEPKASFPSNETVTLTKLAFPISHHFQRLSELVAKGNLFASFKCDFRSDIAAFFEWFLSILHIVLKTSKPLSTKVSLDYLSTIFGTIKGRKTKLSILRLLISYILRDFDISYVIAFVVFGVQTDPPLVPTHSGILVWN